MPKYWKRAARLITLAVTVAAASIAQAQTYPSKVVKIVAPFPPGGTTDTMARLLAAELGKQFGQNVIVENKGGANGNIGSDLVAKAPPDGYTLLLSGVGSNAINYALYAAMPYKDADFAHISLLATGPNILAVNPDFPAKTFAEFLTVTRANPDKYAHASPGNGSSGHLTMEMLKQAAGLKLVHVPYKGGAAAISDTIAGQVPVVVNNQDAILPFAKSAKLRALAVTSAQRNPAYPDVPTIAESGFPGFQAVSWFGLSAPAGTPPDVLKRLSEATMKAMGQPALKQQLESVGFVVVGGTPAQLNEWVTGEIANWGKAVKASGARAE